MRFRVRVVMRMIFISVCKAGNGFLWQILQMQLLKKDYEGEVVRIDECGCLKR